MNRFKKGLSLLLISVFLVSDYGHVRVDAATEYEHIANKESISDSICDINSQTVINEGTEQESIVWINPVHKDSIDADIVISEYENRVTYLNNANDIATISEGTEYLSIDEAAKVMRQNLEASVTNFSISLYISDEDYISESYTWDILQDKALAHTGIPTEGDYLNWRCRSANYSVEENLVGDVHQITYSIIDFGYYTTAEEEQEMDAAVAELLNKLGIDTKSDYEKVYEIYDYICRNVSYDHDNTSVNGDETSIGFYHAHTAYGALMNGKAVCQGYATLLYRLLLECGIDNRVVAGGNHGWNIICLDGMYYNGDTTWDAGQSVYSYFLIGSAYFRNDFSHRGYEMYVTPEFVEQYPVSTVNYTDIHNSDEWVSAEIISSGSCGPNAVWELDGNGTLKISGTGEISDFGDCAFSTWNDLDGWIKKIEIEEGITSIGDYAFYNCSAVEQVTIPNTVVRIGAYAFALCDSLTYIELPNSVQTVGEYTFFSCPKLEMAVLSNNLSVLERYMFHLCRGLKSVEIPSGVKSIGDYVFYYCDALNTIEIPETVTTIGHMAFYFAFPLEGEQSLKLPDSVTAVGSYCFGFSGIEEVIWSEKAERLEEYTFYHAYHLKNIKLPDTLEYIGAEAFSHCVNMESISIPSNVTEIKNGAFYACTGLTEISLPDGISEIAGSMFEGCSGLEHVTLPENIKIIDSSAFARTAIKEIQLPENLEVIGYGVFEQCIELTSILIPQYVKEIGEWAFAWCEKLNAITFMGDAPALNNGVFSSFRDVTATAYYPAENVTWTQEVMQDYGGNITWVAYDSKSLFTDVTKGAYYYDAVEWAVTNNITNGYGSDTIFNPDGTCTRGQVVTFLWRANGSPEPASMNNPFTDVKSSDYYYKAVLWAVENGITAGYGSDTIFNPDGACTRGQVATFLWRAEGQPGMSHATNPFTDVTADEFYYDAVLWAVENGITNGYGSDTIFNPDGVCTRGQIVTFLYRAMK